MNNVAFPFYAELVTVVVVAIIVVGICFAQCASVHNIYRHVRHSVARAYSVIVRLIKGLILWILTR